MSTIITIPAFLILTFSNTGVIQKYAFADLKECEAIKPAVTQLYEGLRQPITLECVPRQDIEPVQQPVKTRQVIKYKESYKIKTSYKF